MLAKCLSLYAAVFLACIAIDSAHPSHSRSLLFSSFLPVLVISLFVCSSRDIRAASPCIVASPIVVYRYIADRRVSLHRLTCICSCDLFLACICIIPISRNNQYFLCARAWCSLSDIQFSSIRFPSNFLLGMKASSCFAFTCIAAFHHSQIPPILFSLVLFMFSTRIDISFFNNRFSYREFS